MGGGSSQQTYQVPWKLIKPDESVKEGLIVYWVPSSTEEFQKSSLRESRTLVNYSSQCVTMGVVDPGNALGQKLTGTAKPPVAVLATPDGNVVSKLENKDGKLKVQEVEKMLETEVKRRESSVEEHLKGGKDKAKAGDSAAAIQELRAVVDQKCLFPKKAKDAAKELKKLGVDVASIPDGPNYDPQVSARIQQTMKLGLAAEMEGKYAEAAKLYTAASKIDSGDAAPLRYLGEVYRHHTGEWDKARTAFEAILNMEADPLSRAVAQHGLGKMTIHEGEFKKGLALMEASVETYPLALAYRNLAVYWNSEGDTAKADYYTKEALKLDPKDPYNLVFAAAFMAGNGHGDEALKIARENESLMPASYNLAAVYAQLGQKDKALSLLKRHFFQYERYRAVRSKEMMEARVDAVFASLKDDAAFVALTSGADGKLPIPDRGTGMRSGGSGANR